MSPIAKIKYACAIQVATMIILGPIDMAMNFQLGIFNFFLSYWSFLLFIPYYFIAPYVREALSNNH